MGFQELAGPSKRPQKKNKKRNPPPTKAVVALHGRLPVRHRVERGLRAVIENPVIDDAIRAAFLMEEELGSSIKEDDRIYYFHCQSIHREPNALHGGVT